MAKKKREPRPHAVYCLWEIDQSMVKRGKGGYFKDTFGKLWKLVEAYGVDQDGYACTESKHASDDRHSYDNWMNKPCWYDKANDKVVYECPPDQDPGNSDPEPVPGRVVTGWSIESGVFLAAFNPLDRPVWFSPFTDKLYKGKAWVGIIHDGGSLYLGTARAAEKIMFGRESGEY